MSAKRNGLLRVTLIVGNCLLICAYALGSSMILKGWLSALSSSAAYEFHPRVVVASALLLVLCALLVGATIKATRSPSAFFIAAAAILLLAALEVYESIMLIHLYGPVQPTDFGVYLRGPLLMGWAIINCIGARVGKSCV